MSTYNYSGDNSDSGFYNQSSQTARNTPIHIHTSSNTTDLSSPSQYELSQYNQPFYANAPPKPKRLNDGRYSSPSPDMLDRHNIEMRYIYPNNTCNRQPVYKTKNNSQSPVTICNSHHLEYVPTYNQSNKRQLSDVIVNNVSDYGSMLQNVERRTPDTYGRSNSNALKGQSPSDYEDIYTAQYTYKRPLSPLAYSNVKKVTPVITPVQRLYTPVSMIGPKDIMPHSHIQMKQTTSNISRPHSADFLEYEVNQRQVNVNAINNQPRPKSSLDIIRNIPNDNYFYTEEGYAEKMRKSIQYLPKTHVSHSRNLVVNQLYTQPISSKSTTFNNRAVKYIQNEPEQVRSHSALSDGSLLRELEIDLKPAPQSCSDREGINSRPLSRHEQMYGYSEEAKRRENNQFTRSASARLNQDLRNDWLPTDTKMNIEERKV